MNTHSNKLRLTLLALAAAGAALLGACASDGSVDQARMPHWNNNAPVDARSTTADQAGDAGEAFDTGPGTGRNGSWWNQ